MDVKQRILITGDSTHEKNILIRSLLKNGYDPILPPEGKFFPEGDVPSVALINCQSQNSLVNEIIVEFNISFPHTELILLLEPNADNCLFEGLLATIHGYLHKPLDFRQLSLMVGKAMEIAALRKQNSRITGQSHANVPGEISETEKMLPRANRDLIMLNHANRLLSYASNETDLLQSVCDTIVQSGGYRMAWIGYKINDATCSLQPVVHSGFENGFLQDIRITWNESETEQCPEGKAIQNGSPCICSNLHDASDFVLWKEQAIQRGYAASISLPLGDDNEIFGVLTIFSANVTAFDEKEIELLSNFANDCAFGISSLRAQAERKNMKNALLLSEARFRSYVDNAPDLIITIYSNYKIQFINKTISGVPAKERIGMNILDSFSPEHINLVKSAIDRVFQTGEPGYYEVNTNKDGTHKWFSTHIGAIREEGKIKSVVLISRDITEKKQKEKALAESEERFRKALDNIFDAFMLLSPLRDNEGSIIDFTMLDCNSRLEEKVPFVQNEIIGNRLSNLFPFFYDGCLFERYKQVAEEGTAHEEEFCCQKEVGKDEFQKTCFHHQIVPVGDKIAVITRDITSRKEIDQKISRLIAILEATTDFVAIIDADGNPQYFNKEARKRLLGIEEKIIAPEHTYYASHPEWGDKVELLKGIAKAIRHGSWVGETVYFSKDYSAIPVSQSIIPHKNERGELEFLSTIARDISEQKNAERILRERTANFEAIAENAFLGIAIFSKEGNILYANSRFSEKTGYTLSELLQLNIRNLVSPQLGEKIISAIKNEIIEKTIDQQKELEMIQKDGTRLPVETTGTRILWKGKPASIGFILDISKRKEAEKKIQQLTQSLIKAEEIERQKMSYDLHDNLAQILSALLVHCSTLQAFNENSEKKYAESKEVIEKITEMIKLCIATVRDMSYELYPHMLKKIGLTRTLFDYCHEFSAKQNIPIDFFSAGTEHLKLNYDAQLSLYRIVRESLQNIKKHAEASEIVIRLIASHPNLLLRIEDNGKGFDVEKKLGFSSKEKKLGLGSIEERIRLLDGKINILSKVGFGTKIFCEIPVA